MVCICCKQVNQFVLMVSPDFRDRSLPGGAQPLILEVPRPDDGRQPPKDEDVGDVPVQWTERYPAPTYARLS
jgi:hypothetical protein